MKTVFLLVPSLGIGGQEKIAINTAYCLKEKYNVKIIVFQNEAVEYEYPCEVINLQVPTAKGTLKKVLNQIKRIGKVAKLRWKYNAVSVMSFGNTANITNAFSGIFSPGKTISAIHGFAELRKTVSMKAVLRFSNHVICIAKAMQEQLLGRFPKAKNTVVIENGYDTEDVVNRCREHTDITLPHPSIISMGRMEHVKGFDRLIKAFAIARRECPDWNLVLIGKGDLYEDLQALCEQEGVADSVCFLGHQSNPHAYLKQADMYVLSSRNEGFPNALIEALCCELPIVAVDCQSGPREILSEHYQSSRIVGVVKEKYGVLVEESASEEQVVQNLAQAIITLAKDKERMQIYRESGIQRANQFDNDVYKRKIISLMEK